MKPALPALCPTQAAAWSAAEKLVAQREMFIRHRARSAPYHDREDAFFEVILRMLERGYKSVDELISDDAYVKTAVYYRSISLLRKTQRESAYIKARQVEFSDGNSRKRPPKKEE